MPALTTPNPPAGYPMVAGATWHRESGPRDVVSVDGEEMPFAFAASEEMGWVISLVTANGLFLLENDGKRYRLRRTHGRIVVKVAKPAK